jgi:plasmid stabilization system protein ParE
MSAYVLHPEAYTDLGEIWEFIAEDNVDAADRLLEEIHNAIRGLVSFPHQGYRLPI